jgi:hypothetical protein
MSNVSLRLTIPALAGLAFVAVPVRALASPAAPPAEAVSEERVAALEARVAELEAFLADMGFGQENASAGVASEELLLPVVVTRKYFREKDPAHARWEDYVDMEVEYDTSALSQPAMALKGTLVFSDSFGEVRFELPTQVTEIIEPGRPVRQRDVRFKYNQFREAHQWMHDIEPKKMHVALRISTVMYRDGSTVEYR